MVALRNVPGPMSHEHTSRFSSGIPQLSPRASTPQLLRFPRTLKSAYPRFSQATSGHRFYSPDLGSWLSKDPLEEHASAAARIRHGKIESQMLFAASVMLQVAADEALAPEVRLSALVEAIYWYEGIRSLKSGHPSFSLRWRDAAAASWLFNDPTAVNGGINQFTFCANNPQNSTDPTGCGLKGIWRAIRSLFDLARDKKEYEDLEKKTRRKEESGSAKNGASEIVDLDELSNSTDAKCSGKKKWEIMERMLGKGLRLGIEGVAEMSRAAPAYQAIKTLENISQEASSQTSQDQVHSIVDLDLSEE